MNVTLVFPPNRNIPATAYGGLPLLAGCLEHAGHRARVVDANLEVFERLLKRETLEQAKAYFDQTWNELRSKTVLTPDEMRHLQGLATLAVVPFEELFRAEEAGRILRTREEFLEPEKANWAYDLIANLIRAVYSINPIFYPLKAGYLDELFGYLETDFQNPISQITENVVIDQVLAQEPDLVAVSIPFNEQTCEAFAFAKALKKRAPHIKTIVGGSIISSFHEMLCKDERFFQYFDYAMPGEADESFPAFVTALAEGKSLADIPNLWWRDEAGEAHAPSCRALPNLNELPKPNYSLLEIERYFLPTPVINYQTSRGCYYGKCTFCSFDIKANFRFRKARLVIEDIEQIQEQTGVRHLMFWDPLTPPRLMRDIAKWNRERPEEERFFWAAETKFEKVFTDQRFTDLLSEGGAKFLQFGYESGNQEVLDAMVKGNDLSRVHLMLEAMRRSDIAVSVQWFIGFPGATYEQDVQSYKYLDSHRDAVVLSCYLGVFAISPDDDIFLSGGDMYDIDLFQKPDGRWDFVHRDGKKHYDRSELDAAFLARGDREQVTRMNFYVYLTEAPERVREITGFERGGHFPTSWEELQGQKPFRPAYNFVRTYDFDIFTPPEEQGISAEGGALPKTPSNALLQTQTQVVHKLDDDELKLVELADGTRTTEELVEALGGDTPELRARLLTFVRRGLLVLPHRERKPKEVVAA